VDATPVDDEEPELMEPTPPPPPGWYRFGWNFGSIVFAMLIGVMVGSTVDVIAESIGGLETNHHAIDVASAWPWPRS
jgi:hypothetical protein